ncbi:GD17659 [Drosophila simulans]|uniref:GD17659 n=1 Tax=Drosophila simulans TaxID=7240 RepID=B4NSW8_DROSI|nr:GD17659 [Drosophila simulans]
MSQKVAIRGSRHQRLPYLKEAILKQCLPEVIFPTRFRNISEDAALALAGLLPIDLEIKALGHECLLGWETQTQRFPLRAFLDEGISRGSLVGRNLVRKLV